MISNTCVAPPVGNGNAGTPSRRMKITAKLFSWKTSIRPPSVLSPSPARLPACEHVRLRAGLKEGDLQRPLADPLALARELVETAVPEQAVAVLVDVDAV